MIQETSLLAYYNSILPNLPNLEKEVLREILKHEDITDKEIAHNTGLELSCVNGRRNKLVEKGLVVESQKRYSRAGRTKNKVIAWKINRYASINNSHLKPEIKEMIKQKTIQPSMI